MSNSNKFVVHTTYGQLLGRLAEFLEPTKNFTNQLSFLLATPCICDLIETARRIAEGGYREVTSAEEDEHSRLVLKIIRSDCHAVQAPLTVDLGELVVAGKMLATAKQYEGYGLTRADYILRVAVIGATLSEIGAVEDGPELDAHVDDCMARYAAEHIRNRLGRHRPTQEDAILKLLDAIFSSADQEEQVA